MPLTKNTCLAFFSQHPLAHRPFSNICIARISFGEGVPQGAEVVEIIAIPLLRRAQRQRANYANVNAKRSGGPCTDVCRAASRRNGVGLPRPTRPVRPYRSHDMRCAGGAGRCVTHQHTHASQLARSAQRTSHHRMPVPALGNTR